MITYDYIIIATAIVVLALSQFGNMFKGVIKC